jgi:hypothetical protein
MCMEDWHIHVFLWTGEAMPSAEVDHYTVRYACPCGEEFGVVCTLDLLEIFTRHADLVGV